MTENLLTIQNTVRGYVIQMRQPISRSRLAHFLRALDRIKMNLMGQYMDERLTLLRVPETLVESSYIETPAELDDNAKIKEIELILKSTEETERKRLLKDIMALLKGC